jgi:hypothetical protein
MEACVRLPEFSRIHGIHGPWMRTSERFGNWNPPVGSIAFAHGLSVLGSLTSSGAWPMGAPSPLRSSNNFTAPTTTGKCPQGRGDNLQRRGIRHVPRMKSPNKIAAANAGERCSFRAGVTGPAWLSLGR